ncbi:MAG TPA: FHA domain-containing protein, partial [Myxococcota bacterium]|nr:FHA domain-containing protein [Myxococcota bacterium]
MRLSSALLAIPGHHPPTLCYPGSLIGRIGAARLRIHHPGISEAHALVSARDGGLWLLALRRPLQVGGRPEWQVQLHTGSAVEAITNHDEDADR